MKSSVVLNRLMETSPVCPVTQGEWQVMGDVHMARHTTQTTVTERTLKKNPLEA